MTVGTFQELTSILMRCNPSRTGLCLWVFLLYSVEEDLDAGQFDHVYKTVLAILSKVGSSLLARGGFPRVATVIEGRTTTAR